MTPTIHGRTCTGCGEAIAVIGSGQRCAECAPADTLVECIWCGVVGMPDRISAHDCPERRRPRRTPRWRAGP